MNPWQLLTNGLWAGLFAAGLGILLTAPPRFAGHMFLCGFVGRVACSLLESRGLSHGWSTVIAATAVVLTASALIRRNEVSPVVLVTGILPLGASVALFKAIIGLLRIASLDGEELSQASVALAANLSQVFTSTLAIALGITAGLALVRLLSPREGPIVAPRAGE